MGDCKHAKQVEHKDKKEPKDTAKVLAAHGKHRRLFVKSHSEAHSSSFSSHSSTKNGKTHSKSEKKSSNMTVDNNNGKKKCHSDTHDTVMKDGKVVKVRNGKGGCKNLEKK